MTHKIPLGQLGKRLLVLVALCAFGIVGSISERARASAKDSDSARMTFAQGMHVLHHWLGLWTAVERHFDSLGRVAGEAKGTEEIRSILDDRAIFRVYRSEGTADAYQTHGTFSFSESEGSIVGVWFDNRSTIGPTTSKASWNRETRTITYENSHSGPGGTVETYRVVERFIDDDHRSATTYRVRGKELIKLLEVSYARAEPCPESKASMRIIYDGIEE